MKRFIVTQILLFTVVALHAQTVGFFSQTPASQEGYVLFAPISSNNTYLIDKCGRQVHTWMSAYKPGQSVYLLGDGTLLRPGNKNNAIFTAGGAGGIVERYDWSGAILWSYSISGPTQCQHHDVCQLPNGNILAIVWELKSTVEAVAAGRNPALLGTSLWSEKIVELQPSGASANIVWEWQVWDHLVQDFDAAKLGFDTVANHPELIDLNYTGGPTTNADWLHINSIDYNPQLDQIMVSVHNMNEIWIIDHNTTTAQAASHTGGAHNKGGDLLYRWGNPEVYRRGSLTNRKLFGQHNAHWIANGLTDSGKIMIFNNGGGRPDGNYSTVDVIDPPVDGAGNYSLPAGAPYLPATWSWQYKAAVPTSFYGMNISGAQRLANGNTLICQGPSGTLFEVDTVKNIAWKYVAPVNNSGAITQGTTPTQNATFRCTLYPSSFSGFSGHTLVATQPIEINPLTYDCLQDAEVSGTQINNERIKIINPVSTSLSILANTSFNDVTITVYDINGRKIAEYPPQQLRQGSPLNLPLPERLTNGVYLLQIMNERLCMRTMIIKVS